MIKLPVKGNINSILLSYQSTKPSRGRVPAVMLGILHLTCHRHEDALLEKFFAQIV